MPDLNIPVIEEIYDVPDEDFDLNEILAEEEIDAPDGEIEEVQGQISIQDSDAPQLSPWSENSVNKTPEERMHNNDEIFYQLRAIYCQRICCMLLIIQGTCLW
jgi:hypothetical protein